MDQKHSWWAEVGHLISVGIGFVIHWLTRILLDTWRGSKYNTGAMAKSTVTLEPGKTYKLQLELVDGTGATQAIGLGDVNLSSSAPVVIAEDGTFTVPADFEGAATITADTDKFGPHLECEIDATVAKPFVPVDLTGTVTLV